MEDAGSNPVVGSISADVMQTLVDISFSESEFLRVRVPSSAPINSLSIRGKDTTLFYAFIVVCAVLANDEVDLDQCIKMDDTFGPYKTEENCVIRSRQMVDDVLYGDLNEPMFFIMGYPPSLQVDGYCKKVPEGIEV